MPNYTIYVPDDVAEGLERWPEINKSKVSSEALREAIRKCAIKAGQTKAPALPTDN